MNLSHAMRLPFPFTVPSNPVYVPATNAQPSTKIPSRMKTSVSLWLALALFAGLPPVNAQPTHSAAGHWEGAITLPGTALAVRVDLEERSGAWSGSIDIPVQGLRGFLIVP